MCLIHQSDICAFQDVMPNVPADPAPLVALLNCHASDTSKLWSSNARLPLPTPSKSNGMPISVAQNQLDRGSDCPGPPAPLLGQARGDATSTTLIRGVAALRKLRHPKSKISIAKQKTAQGTEQLLDNYQRDGS